MIYRDYGRTGLKASRLGYGVMRLPTTDGKVDMPAACDVLRRAFDLGINFFDSHHDYHDGGSELAIGEALGDVRDKIIIQTKCPFYRPEKKGDTYRDRLETALQKTHSDYIDILFAHSVSSGQWEEFGGTFLDFARSAKREGLIRHLGFSCHDKVEFAVQLIESGDFEAALFPYNLIETRYAPCFARAHELGLATAAMNPVAGGRLGPPNPELLATVDRPIAGTVELALRFAFSNSDIDVILSGMTRPEWVEQNVAIAQARRYLTQVDRKQIEKMLAEKDALAKLYCTACGYCMPCPNGVDIPFNFNLLNMYRLYGLKDWTRDQYRNRLKAERKHDKDKLRASACTQCEDCLPKCPNQIPIIDQLEEVDKILGACESNPVD